MKTIDLVVYDMFSCTDLSPEDISKVEITEIAENDFRVEYNANDPFSGFLYYIRIRETATTYEFEVYRTAYGDTGIVVRDKNLNFLYHRDIETREIVQRA